MVLDLVHVMLVPIVLVDAKGSALANPCLLVNLLFLPFSTSHCFQIVS